MRCLSCAGELAASATACPRCGAAVDVAALQTRQSLPDGGLTQSVPAQAPPPPGARFSPGSLLGGRYRIVGPLGKGGMGEVYRADDLKLGRPVALKFLPQPIEDDPAWLARFHNEARLARDVTHPSVCRVHDIGEANGLHFISMEYVDGEDLASLVRRIGRLSRDKGLEIARQLCAGLAAAHAQGVLHRDLKPANVMIDGRGRVRIADFGLAGLAGGIAGAEVASGTPAYMAPEQALGQEVSVQSDVYSLGLVLYEIFTGRPAFTGTSRADLLRAHAETPPTSPSQVVADLDPAIERVILRCLEKSPRARFASAAAISAALPGKDPLAAAIAAGVTPSPEMVAAAGEVGAVRPAVALRWMAAALSLGALAYTLTLTLKPNVVQRVPLELSPEALSLRARDALDRLGLAREAHRAYGLEYDRDVWRHLAQTDSGRRWDSLPTGRPALVYFWYRESPEPLVSTARLGVVYEDVPAPLGPGMLNASFDTRGRLTYLRRVPHRDLPLDGSEVAPDWGALFREAGLDLGGFRQIETGWAAPVYADRRATWAGTYGSPEVSIRIRAAAVAGRPVYFEIVGPWHRPPASTPVFAAANLLVAVLLAGSALIARRNLRLGRGDRRGAFRVAGFLFLVMMLDWLFQASHLADPGGEWSLLTRAAGLALFRAASLWVYYLAFEPYVRRIWPQALVSWSRLLAGGLRDPLVGRDVLIGLAAGWAVAVLGLVLVWAPPALAGSPLRISAAVDLSALLGPGRLAGATLDALRLALESGFWYVTLLLIMRILLRLQWLAAVGFVAALTAVRLSLIGHLVGSVHALDPIPLALAALTSYLLITRVGLLAQVAGSFPLGLGLCFPLVGPDVGAWYGAAFAIPVVLSLGLLAYAFHTALAGQPLFKDDILR